MFVVLLKFLESRERAGAHGAAHVAWVKRGIADGVFLVAGSLQADQGGMILACNTTADVLRARVDQDPFVAEGVVGVEIIEVSPVMADERFQFLLQR